MVLEQMIPTDSDSDYKYNSNNNNNNNNNSLYTKRYDTLTMIPLESSSAVLNDQQQHQPKKDDYDGLSSTNRKRAEILLPPTSVQRQQQQEEEDVKKDCDRFVVIVDFVDVDHWMVWPGSIVKKGETVAMAVQKTLSINNNRNDIKNKQKELELERIDPVITTTSAAGVRTIRLPLHEGTTDPLQLQQPSNHLHHQQQQWAQHYVKLRPHVNDLLRWIESTYEVSVYTAGTKHYAEEATMVLCRNLVGSNRDWDDIERLRYQVQVQLQMAYHHYQQQQQQIMINDTSRNNKTNTMDNTDDIGNNNVAAKNKRTNDQIQQQQLQQKEDDKEKEEEIMDMNDDDDDDNDDTKHKPVKKKPKKISFAPVSTVEQEHTNHHPDEENNNPITTTRTTTTSSYHHTKSDHNNMITKDDDEEEELERLQQELVQADELEQAARRLRQKLFGSRVYSRTDLGDLGQHVKSHKRIFPWLCFADINNAAGTDLSESKQGNNNTNNNKNPYNEQDQQLLWTRDILDRLHQQYYYHYSNQQCKTTTGGNGSTGNRNRRRTVPEILKQMRKTVLPNCTLVFSGLVPLHKQQSITAAAASPNTTVRPPIVRYAQSLGAKTQDKVDETVTHNVAAKDGSEKATIARTIPGCLVVRPGWLMESYWSIRKANVQPYLMAQGPAAIPIKKDENDDDDDDDDDGFALELEDELLNG
ncbi:NLI interacting factor-like phosphatase [Nitzschia inconspicua]|uniref:protein-serine/threonine phosphatase n=1 Tax=Nitzschia inconspicua TaxID=303405 RepID=A0A9K3LSI7_9STRA|nr:NLI interacting factor-like phosphatase [Nitzschia inconspicua]